MLCFFTYTISVGKIRGLWFQKGDQQEMLHRETVALERRNGPGNRKVKIPAGGKIIEVGEDLGHQRAEWI